MCNKLIFIALLFFVSTSGFSQDISTTVKVGDTFKIADVENNDYKAIDFPRANFVIKNGGIYSFERVKNEVVEVSSIKTTTDGKTIATIKRASKGKFFNSHKYIKVDIAEALANGELVRI